MTTALFLSTYQPNFSDPRVIKRVKTALLFCKPMLVQKKAQHISSTTLTKIFGNQKSSLSARLRYKLLQREGSYTPGKHSYSYSLKRDGYLELATAINQEIPSEIDIATELYGPLAHGSELPKYTEPIAKGRRYSSFQSLPKTMRATVFKGWFDYDIEAAAPTLIHQLACLIHKRLWPLQESEPFPSVARFILEKNNVRHHIAQITRLDIPTVKSLLAALFFQAPLAAHPKRAIYRIAGRDASVIDKLKTDEFVRDFRRDLSRMWGLVLTDENANNGLSFLRTGRPVLKPATKGKQRMALYMRLERQVVDVMESAIIAEGLIPLLMHDGFMVKSRVDADFLVAAVREQTGFMIKLSEREIGAGEAMNDNGEQQDIIDFIHGESL